MLGVYPTQMAFHPAFGEDFQDFDSLAIKSAEKSFNILFFQEKVQQ